VRLQGSGKLKNRMTSWGIEPQTFRLVAQCLNQLRYRVPISTNMSFGRAVCWLRSKDVKLLPSPDASTLLMIYGYFYGVFLSPVFYFASV
jgi:hypothetical protein